MAGNCVCNLLSGIGSCIIGSLRVVLFLICALEFLWRVFGIFALLITETYVSEFNFPGVNIHISDYVILVVLGVLSLVGAHGAYSRNPKYLKTYALGISIYAVVYFLLTFTYLTTTDWNKQNHSFEDQMKDYAKKYQFDVKPNEEANQATRAWDLIQSKLTCCGLKKPADWFDWRSDSKQQLPRSCCINLPIHHNDVCKIDEPDSFKMGCSERIETMMHSAFLSVFLTPLVSLLLASIAVIVAKQEEPDYNSATQSAPPRADASNYQRFEGSVYVRQPALNDAYAPNNTSSSVAPNKPLPPVGNQLYPNVMSEKASSPPPSYMA